MRRAAAALVLALVAGVLAAAGASPATADPLSSGSAPASSWS